MAAPRKSVLYNTLKTAHETGRQDIYFEKTYVQYTEAELEALIEKYGLGRSNTGGTQDEWDRRRAELTGTSTPVLTTTPPPVAQTPPPTAPTRPRVPRSGISPEQQAAWLGVPLKDRGEDRAGLEFNKDPEQAIRVDSQGFVWYQDEVMKPAIPKPRARRVIRTESTGFKTIERRNSDGSLDESFEVSGDEGKTLEIKTTLASWQVGIYWDPRLPFKVHVYDGRRAFDFAEIVRHYDGLDLIPSAVKRVYIGSDLCFDIKSVRDAMEQQLRDLQLGRSFR